MQKKRWLNLLGFLISFILVTAFAVACSAEVPADWQVTDAYELFSLRLPPGWELREVQGIDSAVGEIVGDDVRLQFDYGWYSNSLAEDNDPDHVVTYEKIDGRKAKMVRPKGENGGITGVYFEQVDTEESDFGVNRLAISGTGSTKSQQETVFKFFRTIQFPR